MKKTVYLSGPIFGCDKNNYTEFQLAEELLNKEGIKCINPHTFLEELVAKDVDQASAMRSRILLMMCEEVTEIVTLFGWETAADASKEVAIARIMNIPVTPIVSILKANSNAAAN